MSRLEKRFRNYNSNNFQRVVGDITPNLPVNRRILVIEDIVLRDGLENLVNRHEDFVALYIVRQGNGIHVIDGVPYGIARGDVYIMGSGATHAYTECKELVLDAAYFTPFAFSQEMQDVLDAGGGIFELLSANAFAARAGGSHWFHLNPSAYNVVGSMFSEIREESRSGDRAGTVLVPGLLFRLLVQLSRFTDSTQAVIQRPDKTIQKPGSSMEQNAVVAAAVRYIDENFSGPIKLDEIASEACLSPDRLTSLFGNVMGQTPRDYIRYLRIEKAKFLLSCSEDSVSEIGSQAGFSEAPYFSRVFRESTGMTPSEYKRSRQVNARKLG